MIKQEVVPSGKEKILVVAVDFDGCLGHTTFTNNYKQMLKDNKDKNPEEIKKALKGVILQSNPTLIEDIQQRCEGYDRVIVIVGSNRQSAFKDQHDAEKNMNGSCFSATEMLADILREQTKKPVELDPYLISDSILEVPPGTNFRLEKQEKPAIFEDYQMAIDKKYRLAFFQMQEICGRNPQANISYVHYDDRDDIVRVTAQAFGSENGENLPPNMQEAKAVHYELYNPYASLESLAKQSKKEAEKNPEQLVDQPNIDQLNKALVIVSQEAELWDGLIAKHKAPIQKLEKQRADLVKKRESMVKGTKEYINTTKQIFKIDSKLMQLKKPQELINRIRNIRKKCIDLCGKDLPECRLTWEQYNQLAKEFDQLTQHAVHQKEMEAFPKLLQEYRNSSLGSERESITEFGNFTRQVESGHQISPTHLNLTVKELMKDSIVERVNTYTAIIKEGERIVKPIVELEEALNAGTVNIAQMIIHLDPSLYKTAIEILKKAYIKDNITFENLNDHLKLLMPGEDSEINNILKNAMSEKKTYQDNQLIDSKLPELQQHINQGSFETNALDFVNEIELTESNSIRIMEPIESGFMSGKIPTSKLRACLNILYSNPVDQLNALERLYNKVQEDNHSHYAPPQNRFVRFLKGIVGKENYSSVRLNHIAQLQSEYYRIVHSDPENKAVKAHVARSTLPDYETKHMFIGINHATTFRKHLMALYHDDFYSTMDQLFTLSTESKNPFQADGPGGFVATQLLNAKGRLTKFKLNEVTDYILKHPDRAPMLLAAYRKNFEAEPELIARMLRRGDPTLNSAIRDSKICDSKKISAPMRQQLNQILQRPPRPSAAPPIPATVVSGESKPQRPPPPSEPPQPLPPEVSATSMASSPSAPTQPEPTKSQEKRPPPPTRPAPSVTTQAEATRSQGKRPPPPTRPASPVTSQPETTKSQGKRPPPPTTRPTPLQSQHKHEGYESPEVTKAMEILEKASQESSSTQSSPTLSQTSTTPTELSEEEAMDILDKVAQSSRSSSETPPPREWTQKRESGVEQKSGAKETPNDKETPEKGASKPP